MYPLLFSYLDRLGDEAAHLIRGLLHGWSCVGVGVQGEARRVVAQDAGDN